jgi:hypothetical protein
VPLAVVVAGERSEHARVTLDARAARVVRLEVAVIIREQEPTLASFCIAQVTSELFRFSHDLERMPDE